MASVLNRLFVCSSCHEIHSIDMYGYIDSCEGYMWFPEFIELLKKKGVLQ